MKLIKTGRVKNIQNTAVFSEKHQKMIQMLNQYSLLFHILLACIVCLMIECISRHSLVEAVVFMFDRNLVFLYNALIVYASLLLVYLVQRRAALRVMICAFWVLLGTINGCVLAKRVTPFGFTDLKMIRDLFTMQSNYFSVSEAVLAILAVIALIVSLVVFWIRGPKYQGRIHRVYGIMMITAFMLVIPGVTNAAVNHNILIEYFGNLAQGYKDYGFIYSFSASVIDRGMNTPEEYSEESIETVLARMNEEPEMFAMSASLEPVHTVKTTASEEAADEEINEIAAEDAAYTEDETADTEQNTEKNGEIPVEDSVDFENPNIICILLESFVDPALIRFLKTDIDPVPNFHELYDTYTSGYLQVPVVGAGTANTEFEILTGMGMQFFGLGEYPYKTILKETNCESIAGDLKTLGYGAHAVHNNGGNFYSRADVFSMFGFDTFTCKEMMDITEYTPIGTWPLDDILIGEVEKSLDYTPDQPDFVYTITVEGHGEYPREQVLTNPKVNVTAVGLEEGMENSWEYYVNMIHEVDDFIGDMIEMLEQREEPTFVVMFGDHLPTMGLTESDMTTGSLFQTQYVTWNNFGLEKADKNMTSYQLLADMTADLGISNGTMFTYHQNRDTYISEEEYQTGMELLQYDILYGEHYVYDGGNPYPATEIVMGTQDVVIDRMEQNDNYYHFYGENFTRWSKVYVDGVRVKTKYISGNQLCVEYEKIEDGFHSIVVQQMGSSESVFRVSNEIRFNKVSEKKEE